MAESGRKLQWKLYFVSIYFVQINCDLLNVIHLKCFVMKLPCFACDTFEMKKSVTESHAISLALAMSAVGGGNGPVWRPKGGTTLGDLPTTALLSTFMTFS